MAKRKYRNRRARSESASGEQVLAVAATDAKEELDLVPEDDEEKDPVAVSAELKRWSGSKRASQRTVAREERRRRSVARKTRRKLYIGLGGGSIAAMLIIGLLFPSVSHLGGGNTTTTDQTANQPANSTAGTEVDIQPGGVIEVGATHETYSTLPPTSGPRYDESADWGVYTEQLPDEAVVRNLEQGAVVFNYNLSDQTAIDDLREFVEAQLGFPGCFILQPHSAVAPGDVSLTSWGWTETLTGVDRGGMLDFVGGHRNNGPQFLGSTCGADTTLTAPTGT